MPPGPEVQAPAEALTGRNVAVLALVWLGLGLALLPFAWAFGFCFPRGDDFDEATRAMFLFDLPGGLYEVGREWLTWSGRYTYHFLAVFLGKAGEWRPVGGLFCGGLLALHGVAFYGLARAAAVPRRDALPLSALALLGLCASSGALPGYYLLTEALTTGLQSAAALGFFWSLCALWERCSAPGESPEQGARVRRARRRAALFGVLAAGVYEHAALAVLSGAALGCALAWFHDRWQRPGDAYLKSFLRVALWCLGATLFSFLAPGNLARRTARSLDAERVHSQLAAIPADLLQALDGFAASPWPLTAVGLALLLALLRKRDRQGLARGEALLLAALVAPGLGLFSVALTALHALSDVPLHASPKLGASLALYAAFALGFGVFALLLALPRALPGLSFRRRGPALALGAALLLLCCAGDNFQRTLRNAVNGDMALYARAMENRDAWLRHVGGEAPGQGKWRFGLAGELLYPGARSRAIGPDAAVTALARWTRPVFPVRNAGDLPARPTAWPNQWVAWLYGVEAAAATRPDPAAAVDAVLKAAGAPGPDGPLELRLPEAARALGLAGAWRVNARGGPNPTFALDWLVLESEKALPKHLAVLAPSPLSPDRMAPASVQLRLLREAGGNAHGGAMALWAGPELAFAPDAWRVPGRGDGRFHYAFPLGPAAPLAAADTNPAPGAWPAALFLKPEGLPFLRLGAARAVLDSGRESG